MSDRIQELREEHERIKASPFYANTRKDQMLSEALDGWEKAEKRAKELEPMEAMTTLTAYEAQRERAEQAEVQLTRLRDALERIARPRPNERLAASLIARNALGSYATGSRATGEGHGVAIGQMEGISRAAREMFGEWSPFTQENPDE